jgi:glycosyltransferase involved in cell wall biosynthesis
MADGGGEGLRMLVLAFGGPAAAELQERGQQRAPDAAPRIIVAEDDLGATSMHDGTLAAVAGRRGRLLRRLPRPAALALLAWSRRRDVDVVITWGEQIAFPLAALLALTPRRRMRHIAILMWPLDATSPSLLKRLVKQTLFGPIARRGMDRLNVPAPLQRRMVSDRWGIPSDRFVDAQWPIDTAFWRPAPGAGDLICSAGREMRDYPTLLEALDGLDVPCHIAAGTGVRSPVFGTQDERAGNVGGRELPPGVTVGPKSLSELRDLYARSAIVVVPVLPTDSDNGVTTVVEAMAMGRAVIASDTDGKADVLQDGVTCLLVAPQDPAALRAAIQDLWSDPDKRERLGTAGREHVASARGLEQWIDAMRAAAVELGERRPRGPGSLAGVGPRGPNPR